MSHNHEKEIDRWIIESGFSTEIPLMRILDLTPSDLEYDPRYGFENLCPRMRTKSWSPQDDCSLFDTLFSCLQTGSRGTVQGPDTVLLPK